MDNKDIQLNLTNNGCKISKSYLFDWVVKGKAIIKSKTDKQIKL